MVVDDYYMFFKLYYNSSHIHDRFHKDMTSKYFDWQAIWSHQVLPIMSDPKIQNVVNYIKTEIVGSIQDYSPIEHKGSFCQPQWMMETKEKLTQCSTTEQY